MPPPSKFPSLPQDLVKSNIPLTDEQIRTFSKAQQACGRQGRVLIYLLRGYAVLLSPIRRMPDDVLREIFLHCMPWNLHEVKRDAPKMPLVLSRVCSRWRTVALDYGRLWSVLRLDNIYEWVSKPDVCEARIQQLHTWSKRAKGAPLTLYVHLGMLPKNTSMKDVRTFFKNLLPPIAPRVGYLTMAGENLGPIISFAPFTSRLFPNLRSLILKDLSQKARRPSQNTKPVSSFLGGTLQTVHISRLDKGTPSLSLEWERLTHLSISCLQGGDFVTILRQCINLQCGRFRSIDRRPAHIPAADPGPTPSVTTVLPHLTMLAVDFAGPFVDCGIFLDGFDYPKLRVLELGSGDSYRRRMGWLIRPPGIQPQFARLLSSVTELFVAAYLFDTASVISILSCAVKVRLLRLNVQVDGAAGNEIANEILDALVFDERNMLPCLDMFELHAGYEEQPPQVAKLEKVFVSRRPGLHPLRSALLARFIMYYPPCPEFYREPVPRIITFPSVIPYRPGGVYVEMILDKELKSFREKHYKWRKWPARFQDCIDFKIEKGAVPMEPRGWYLQVKSPGWRPQPYQ